MAHPAQQPMTEHSLERARRRWLQIGLLIAAGNGEKEQADTEKGHRRKEGSRRHSMDHVMFELRTKVRSAGLPGY